MPTAPSPDNLVQVHLEFKRFNVGMELGAAIGARDQKRIEKLLPKFVELNSVTALSNKKTTVTYAPPVEELLLSVGNEARIPIAPSKVNQYISGGVLPGEHILIVGRPDAGKSTMAINMGAGFVRKHKRVLYIGNEDRIAKSKTRMVLRLTGLTMQEFQAHPQIAYKQFRDMGGEELLQMIQLHDATFPAIEEQIEAFEPQVLIIDQIRNLKTGKPIDEDMTRKLEALAISMRYTLLAYDLIGISVTQGNDRTQTSTQEPPIWLNMGDIDSSRTGLPAQADLILGLGSNSEMRMRNEIALSFIKNKMSAESNSHDGIILTIDRHRSKIY